MVDGNFFNELPTKFLVEPLPTRTNKVSSLEVGENGTAFEREILVDFYHSTNGEYWKDKSTNNWLEGDHCGNH